MTSSELAQFDTFGLVKKERVFDPNLAMEISAELWRRFAKWDIRRGEPTSWQCHDDKTIHKVMKATRHVRGLHAIYTDSSVSIASALTRSNELDKTRPLLLLTFSGCHGYIADERVPSSMWHLDVPVLPGAGAVGVIALGFINEVRACGGGTMVLAGSHRLLETESEPIKSKHAKRRLRKYAFIRELMDKGAVNRERLLSETACVNGIELKVVELTGSPGDIFFVNPSLLHTITKNHLEEPRMMVRGFYGTRKLQTLYDVAV